MNGIMIWTMGVLAGLCSGLEFTQPPLVADQDSQFTISFTVDEYCPVTVEVIDTAGTVIRHLGSGMLGANAPIPFAQGTLSQALVWNKKNDLGIAVTGTWDIRIGLGLTASYDRSWGADARDAGCGSRSEGIAAAPNGNVVVRYYNSMLMFDSTGAYVKTLIPYPGDLPEDQLRGYGRIRVPGGKNKPIVYCSVNGAVVSAFYSNLKRTGLTVTRQGRIVFNNFCMNNVGAGAYESGGYLGTRGAAKKRRIGSINLDGSCPQDSVWGPYMGLDLYNACQSAVSPDGRTVYTIMDNGTAVRRALLASSDSMTVFISGFTRTRGICTDTLGNIYVSDSTAGALNIYASNGTLIKSLAVERPDQVKVSRVTGEIYVMSLMSNNTVVLTKYSALPGSDSLYSLIVTGWNSASAYPVNMALACTPGLEPKIWLGLNISTNGNQIDCFKDNGAALVRIAGRIIGGPVKYSLGKYLTYGGYLAVTPDETKAYTGFHNIAVLNPATGALSTISSGCNEPTVGPDGYLYRYGNGCWGVCTDSTIYVSGPAAHSFKVQPTMFMGGNASRGIAVGVNGDVYVTQQCADGNDRVYAGHDALHVDVWSSAGVLKQNNLIVCGSNANAGPVSGNVQVDPWGNVFLYHTARPRGVHYQSVFEGQLPDPETAHGTWDQSRCNYYLWGIGSILKFPPTGGSVHYTPATPVSSVPYGNCDGYSVPPLQVDGFHDRTFAVQGATWQYYGMGGTFGFKSVGEPCICSSHRFHVDGYGRVIVPESQRFTVAVLDNNKNEMIRFGEYGNGDQVSSGGNIYFSYPGYVWSVNRSVYVLNKGITRIKLSYPVEWSRNQGLVTAPEQSTTDLSKDNVTVYPLPANPQVTLAVRLEKAGPVEIRIYSPNGGLVKAFQSGMLPAGLHGFEWNGISSHGARVSSGLYIARVKTDSHISKKPILMLK